MSHYTLYNAKQGYRVKMFSKLFNMLMIWGLKSNAMKCHETIHINVKVIIKC